MLPIKTQEMTARQPHQDHCIAAEYQRASEHNHSVWLNCLMTALSGYLHHQHINV
ncbi:hypothetical protein AAC977_09135 [Vibrio gazogenes]|uniref:hypothetical protein n=1 Tax=Vibrio gazogenes TaxID=687 RepID=UPI001F268BF5|nr:hypothetical protein [Vibrio gazogenes]USP12615.1 hypothetical protein MKS89_09130 [Vibrio gazogenes]